MVEELQIPCLVVYDIVDDRVRQRVSECCLDFGLERFQMSAFWGRLTSTRRRELFLKLQDLLADRPGRILIQPISEDDLAKRLVFQQGVKAEEGGKVPRQWPEPGAPKPTVLKF
jgi:CRISPR-associated protein Cas2